MSDPGGESSGYVQRGLLLKQQRRYSEAEGFFRDALAQNPNDSFALMQLASCQLQLPDRARDALQSIDRALAIEPNEPGYHGMRAFILNALDRKAEALKAADAGIELDPHSSFVFTARAQTLLNMEKWRDAEAAARQALALDADNSSAANQLAHALRLQNKMAENAGQIAGMLARDPEDASTHSSAGWAALQRGERRVAEQHFLEALRLDPESEYARQGLLNSFRARSPLFRAYLAYSFWMQKLGGRMRLAFIIGIIVAVNFFNALFTGPMKPIGIGMVVLYGLFVFWVWVARGMGNFILLFDRVAKHALRRGEKIQALFVGGGISVGVPLLITGLAMDCDGLYLPAIALVASAFPFSMTFTNPSRVGTAVFAVIGGAELIMFAAGLSCFAVYGDSAVAEYLFTPAIAGAAVATWLGNVPALRNRRPL